jgi:hypothetical protein
MRKYEALLEKQAEIINDKTYSPQEMFSRGSKFNLGHFHIEGNKLERIVNETGAVSTWIEADSQRELYLQVSAFILGLNTPSK